MNIKEIAKKLNLKTISTPPIESILNTDITTVYTGDLLSDVMGNAPEECIFVTIQAHKNTIAVATLKDCPAVIICNNRSIPDDMKEAAANENIMLYVTEKNQYTISGQLYELLDK
ncbi:MAG TPA: hypothetical protein VFC68_07430 [Treponemataceae bacterium]|nr:hypothetical protein [Treponemataceae bacterium]